MSSSLLLFKRASALSAFQCVWRSKATLARAALITSSAGGRCVSACVSACVYVCYWLCGTDMQRVAGISKDSQADISIDFDVDNPSQVPQS